MSRKVVLSGLMILMFSAAAYAESPAIKARQDILGGFGKAAKPVGAALRGEAPFDLAATQTLLKTIIEGTKKLPELFPDDSKTGGEHNNALPAIWDDKDKFLAGYAKLSADATTALAAIKDEASFKAEMPKVFEDCGACHKPYRKPL